MKILVIVIHPNLEKSLVNRIWVQELEKQEDVTIHDLHKKYPDEQIDVEQEQQLLVMHDRIIFQFPFYWYSSPPLLKKWFDQVLTYGWAYGAAGTNLHGKDFGLAISTGGAADAYQPGGYNQYSIPELTKPFQATSNLIGMRFMKIFKLQGVRSLSTEAILQSAADYINHIKQ